MKTIISLMFGLLVFMSATSAVSAQAYSASYSHHRHNSGCAYNTVYPYTGCTYSNNYQNNYQSSYYYTSGCYTYYYNGQTSATTVASYNCGNQNNYTTHTQPTAYTYYTQPTYTYTQIPTYQTYYNTGYTNTGYYYDTNYNSYGNYNYYNPGFVYTPTTNCYYVNGYYTCY